MKTLDLVEKDITHSVIGAFYEVYNTLGFGFLESVYLLALERELAARGHAVDRQVLVVVNYKGEKLTTQRLDLIVDGKVVVEVKSTQELHSTAARQVYNYLRATDLEVALLLHFGPAAKFHRLISPNSRMNPPDSPPNPPNPPPKL